MKKFTFDVKKTVSYWVEGAEYDLGVANAMFKARKYPYALFMGHLALEKLLKALVVKKKGPCTIQPFTPLSLRESGYKDA
jgi:HEPN domain-containing protein